MMKKALLLVALAAGAVACSSGSTRSAGDGVNNGGGDDDDNGNDSGVSTGDDDTSGGSSGGGSGGSSGGSSSDDGGVSLSDASGIYKDVNAPPVDQAVTLTMDKFQVAGGGEVYKCQQFGNPWTHDVDIVKMDGYMTAGSHHFFLFNMDPTTGRTNKTAIQDCPGNGIEFHPFPYLSQQAGHYVVNFPQEDMGYPMVKANGFMMNAHYLNTSSQPISPTVQITMVTANCHGLWHRPVAATPTPTRAIPDGKVMRRGSRASRPSVSG